jgi:hypothetical protein
MENFNHNIASLTYLTNPLYQKILKKKSQKDTDKESDTSKSDIKFYRKRISSLTKEMLKGDIPDNTLLKSIYETYVNGLIKYFKIMDTTDIIQKQYDNDNNNDNDNDNDNIDNDNDNVESELNLKEINMSSLLKPYNVNTLDNFVVKQQNETNDTKIIPIILEVDLKEPSLKRKGIKDKDKKEKVKDVKDKNVNLNEEKVEVKKNEGYKNG